MAREHDVLRKALDQPRGKPAALHWHVLLDAAHRVCRRPSAESERVLRALLDFDGEVPVSTKSIPHAMPAADILRSLAIQTLARWNPRRHRAAIARVHATTRSHLLAEIARVHLSASGG